MGLFDFFKQTKHEVPYDDIYRELDAFTQASLAMPQTNNPFLLDDKNKHPMIFGYFAGAINQIAQSYQLDEKDKHKIYEHYLSSNFANNDKEYTIELLKYSSDLSQNEDSEKTILIGELAMRKWRAGGPMAEYAPMGLIRLLNT